MSNFGLTQDSFGRLVLIDAEGVRHIDVEPVRSFPFSERRRYISIRDPRGKEIVLVDDMHTLPNHTREVLERALLEREFIPVIRRIFKITGDAGPMSWEVGTDRGETRFVMNSEDDIRRISYNTLVVVDANGGRYFIPNVAELDPHSRRLLEWAM
jgi:hypothetical protein